MLIKGTKFIYDYKDGILFDQPSGIPLHKAAPVTEISM